MVWWLIGVPTNRRIAHRGNALRHQLVSPKGLTAQYFDSLGITPGDALRSASSAGDGRHDSCVDARGQRQRASVLRKAEANIMREQAMKAAATQPEWTGISNDIRDLLGDPEQSVTFSAYDEQHGADVSEYTELGDFWFMQQPSCTLVAHTPAQQAWLASSQSSDWKTPL